MRDGTLLGLRPTTMGVIRFRSEEAAPISNIRFELFTDSSVRMTNTSSALLSSRVILLGSASPDTAALPTELTLIPALSNLCARSRARSTSFRVELIKTLYAIARLLTPSLSNSALQLCQKEFELVKVDALDVFHRSHIVGS